MKPLNKLALSGLLLLTAHSMSFAASYTLHITGSTAFRAAGVNAVVNYLYNNSGTPKVAPTAAYVGSSLTGANESVVVGTLSNGDTITAEFAFTGSVQGIHDTALAVNPPAAVSGASSPWLSPTGNTLSAVTVTAAPGVSSGGHSVASGSAVWTAAAAPDLSLSDVWQTSTLFPAGTTNGITVPALSEVSNVVNGVGVQAFVVVANNHTGVYSASNSAFVANGISVSVTAGSPIVTFSDPNVTSQIVPGFLLSSTYSQNSSAYIPPFAIVKSVSGGVVTLSVAAGGTTGSTATVNTAVSVGNFSNVTKEALYDLYSNGHGSVPISEFTGNPGDLPNPVFAVGRSPDSGTRVAFTETIGLHNETSLSQVYQVELTDPSGNQITTTTQTVGGIQAMPSVTYNGLTLAKGDNGYTSGGSLANFLANPNVVTYAGGAIAPWFFISPLGISDATTAVNGGGIPLTFEGVAYNASAVQTGAYPLWAFEHLYQSPSFGSVPAGEYTEVQGIAHQILTSDAQLGGDLISNLLVTRTTVGDGTNAPYFSTTNPQGQ